MDFFFHFGSWKDTKNSPIISSVSFSHISCFSWIEMVYTHIHTNNTTCPLSHRPIKCSQSESFGPLIHIHLKHTFKENCFKIYLSTVNTHPPATIPPIPAPIPCFYLICDPWGSPLTYSQHLWFQFRFYSLKALEKSPYQSSQLGSQSALSG